MAAHNELGKQGERIARQYLLNEGYQILEANWRSGRAEVDLIGSKNNVIVFAEVKTRSSATYGTPEEFISEGKVRQLEHAAETYIEKVDHHGEIRFDVISILFENKEKYTLTHIDDAFWPD